MTADIEERFQAMARRLDRAERANRIMKFWSSITFATLLAFGSGSFALNATAKQQPPAIVTATQEIDLTSGGTTVASLRLLSGKPNLVFYDSVGKVVEDVGIYPTALPTGHAAGIAVLDGNADIPGTGKVRASLGVTPSGPEAGVGEATYDGNGVVRSAVGSTVDGSVAYGDLFDETGTVRTGLNYYPGVNFTGFFTHDASGTVRSSVGSGVDGSYSGAFIYDNTGALRTGIDLPSGANIGYFNQDADGTRRVSLYESADGLVASLSLVHESGIEGADAISNDEPGLVGSNFAAWNADHTHIASILGVGPVSGDTGFVDTYNASGNLSGHLP